MIVTLTLNPSLDRTLTLQTLRRGEVLRATGARIDPGGKGVNVTRVLRAFDVGSHAVIPCAGPDGEELVRLLSKAGVPVTEVPVGGWTRSNITLVEADGRSTKVNAPGGALTGQEVALLAETVLDRCLSQGTDLHGHTRAAWAVLSGSLPPGVPDTVYAELTALFAEHGVRVAVDTSGAALLAALDAGPDLIKPNRQELATAVGTPLNSIADVVEAADKLLSRGVKAVLASLGADGAVLVDSSGAVLGTADPIEPLSTVGAGDALLAGFLAAGADGPDALVEGMAWARAAVGLPGSQMPDPSDVSREGIRVVRDPGGKPVGAVHLADNG
ncbi:1-phosphofructokinase family hexose kinase [Catenulispora sp. NF23]|uniref:1-phosphofructokinase family hexose kinase n=1 Tax=Catenulispora pinistramenti TaxID=2705254 RepID=A0ABS5KTL9_9ACTN|nr:1-phosphofructokinase family hexose kinase [Catenulispora pinistramenti]MBS2537365.1 1-phosphofructokinase family hexose kinase [Catenulispora pinistramenti]MBS2549355.1 1-phosphofructokinase family hexose kinase [Catenulispora pinistramenti]